LLESDQRNGELQPQRLTARLTESDVIYNL